MGNPTNSSNYSISHLYPAKQPESCVLRIYWLRQWLPGEYLRVYPVMIQNVRQGMGILTEILVGVFPPLSGLCWGYRHVVKCSITIVSLNQGFDELLRTHFVLYESPRKIPKIGWLWWTTNTRDHECWHCLWRTFAKM